ncbi:uncharacterized protein LOC110463863 [Mizuhopecten yessoensis]|uniref:uncharacterized protein LOC110463863 n=1 Tax=Mizuhopecten yessoensis TaxID=6573 RepID=UPI000B45DBB7|nr:uncharacterized protein LOC110463863 [Mizuhopecten yessoensis]
MASGSCADAEKSGIAAKLWAAARNTVNMLTNEADDDTAFRPIENMWDKSPYDQKDDNDEEMETMDMGLKIDAVFTMPLDAYLTQHEEEHISRPIEQILKVEQQAKSRAALCKPCSVVLQKIDHDLSGRHRVFYRQWKRRFDKCGYSCRYKFISDRLRPRPKTPTKTRKPYTYKQDVIKSDSMARSCLENTQQSFDGKDDTPYKANVVDVKQSSNIKTMPLRDILHKKSLSKRDKLRYQYLNQKSSKLKDNSTKSNIMRDQFIHAQIKTSSDPANHLSEDYRTHAEKNNETTTPGKQCTKETKDTLKKTKVKIEPGLELQNPSSDVKSAMFKHIKVKVEPKYEDNEYGDSHHSHIHKDGSRRHIDLKLKTKPGLVSLLKRRQDITASEDITKYSTLKGILGTTDAPQTKKIADFREKHSLNQSRTEASKSKSKSTAPAELTVNALKATVSFAPYKSKMPVNLKPTDNSKTLKTSSTAQENQNIENRSNTVPLVQNTPLFLTNNNQVSSPQVPLQYVLTGTQNPSQVILTGSNSTNTSNPARLVLTGLNAPQGAQNPIHVVLTGANSTGTQNQTVVLTNPNQLTSTIQPQIVLTDANRPPKSQCSQLILANGNTNGPPRLFLANTNPHIPVTQSAQHIVLTNANQAVPNQGQQQLVYANMYTNPNQTNVVQTGQLVLNKIVQQPQQQTNVLNIPSTPQIQLQTITGAQVRNIVPPVQEAAIGQSTVTSIQQPVPVIQTSSVLPSTMNFPPGTLFLKQNCLPGQIPQSGLQALTKLMAEKQNKQAPTVVNIGPRGVENTDSQPTLPVQGKTVTIGNQKYLLVPTVSQGSPAPTSLNAGVKDNNTGNLQYDGFSKLSVAKKMKLLLERSEASQNQGQTLPSQSSKSTSSKAVLHTSIPSETKPDRSSAADTASVIKRAKQTLPTDSHKTSHSNHQTNTDDVIFIDDTDIVPVDIVQKSLTNPRKRNPRKSKPQPRLDYDEFLKKQRRSKQKSKQVSSSDENESTDSEIDIETVDTEPEMAGKGMLIPKTPTMPPGLYQWPDGATIDEKSITLPPNFCKE